MLWGSNVPVTRTPDSPFMTQVRYKGTPVVVISPDYSDASKFADVWLAPKQGTDSALGMAMGHVILKEFFVDRTPVTSPITSVSTTKSARTSLRFSVIPKTSS